MIDIPAVQYNQTFLRYLSDTEGQTKMAAAGRKFVRDHLREESAFRRIMPPDTLDPTDQRVIPSKNSDTLVVRKDLEPQSKAMALTFSTQPDARIVSSKRIDVPVFTISSEMFQMYEQHLLAYEMPVTKIIEENTGKDIQEIEDLEWLTHSEAAVQATGNIIMGDAATADFNLAGGVATGNRFDIQKPDFIDLANALLESGRRKRLYRIWCNDVDFNSIMKWTVEDIGSMKASEILIDGYKYDKVLDWTVVRTIKTDLLQTGNIYGYTAPEFLGFFFVLNDVKFYIDKVANLIRWQAWEDIAASIAHIGSVVKLELYNGQAPGVAGSDALPDEGDLFQQTNPVFAGGPTFPSVTLS